jgi:hypothetical protein
MAQKKLKSNIFLRENLAVMPTGFLAGEELPDWAYELVKDRTHLFEDQVPEEVVTTPAPADQKVGKDYESGEIAGNPSNFPSVNAEGEDDDDDEVVIPRKNASKAIWLKFAKEAIAEGYPVELTGKEDRDGVIAACDKAGALDDEDADES